MVEENYACRDSSKRLEFQNVVVPRLHIFLFLRDLATTSAVLVSFMKAKQRVAGPRGTQLRRFGRNRGSWGPIPLCGILLEGKITSNGPRIRGNVA
jgi:hypothetical protein